jgi:transposase
MTLNAREYRRSHGPDHPTTETKGGTARSKRAQRKDEIADDTGSVEWLDIEGEYKWLGRAQRKLSRKESGSNNYEKQRVEVAKARRRIRRKVLDYHHKPSSWLVEG